MACICMNEGRECTMAGYGLPLVTATWLWWITACKQRLTSTSRWYLRLEAGNYDEGAPIDGRDIESRWWIVMNKLFLHPSYCRVSSYSVIVNCIVIKVKEFQLLNSDFHQQWGYSGTVHTTNPDGLSGKNAMNMTNWNWPRNQKILSKYLFTITIAFFLYEKPIQIARDAYFSGPNHFIGVLKKGYLNFCR